MVENSLAIALDPLLLSLPEHYSTTREHQSKIYNDNKFACLL